MRSCSTTTVFTETCTGKTFILAYKCFKHCQRFKYIAVLDTDEVIVPKKHNSWLAMMKEVVEASAMEPKTISWHFRHVYFIDRMTKEHHNKMIKEQYGIPEYMYMMNKIVRSANHSIGRL